MKDEENRLPGGNAIGSHEMSSETKMLYKLILLYLLDRVDFPMSGSQLSKFITERNYTTWFNVQICIDELEGDNYISKETTRSQTLFRITKEGRETLSFFYKKVSKDIRDDIDIYLTQEKYSLREEVSCLSDFYESTGGEYICELKIIERVSSILELKLAVPTAAAAEAICDRWKQKNADIYAYVLTNLLGDNASSNASQNDN